MNKFRQYQMIAILAAILFGMSAPLSKILLGEINPVMLVAFLYIGSGTGLWVYRKIECLTGSQREGEAPLVKKDVIWLIGAILSGGVIAPILLMSGLRITPASTASLLLNFESVATALIAALFFSEHIGKRVWIAILLITLASILLSWNFTGQWGFSIGAAGIIFACFCWGIDNNFTRNISLKNPVSIVIIKGFSAGFFSLFLALLLKGPIPSLEIILFAMLLGFFSYGLSLVLFVLAMRNLGSARTSALFGIAPFIGAILAFILFKEIPNIMFIISLLIMMTGTIFLLREEHGHRHVHEYIAHEHMHSHTDGHHNHSHIPQEVPEGVYHSHFHIHEPMEHEHPHVPDIHHRHSHSPDKK
jgi:drug/metabolite transporter (DMT)-like permease